MSSESTAAGHPGRRYILVHAMYGGSGFAKEQLFFDRFRQCHGDAARVVLVQNLPQGGFPPNPAEAALQGSNALREFSAWQEGLAHYRAHMAPREDDVVVLTNDTIFRSDRLVGLATDNGLLRLGDVDFDRKLVLGPIINDLSGLRVFGQRIGEQLATYFVALRFSHLESVGGVLGQVDFDAHLAAHFGPELFIHPQTRRFNAFFNQWLGASQPQGLGRWPHSARTPYAEANFAFLRDKAKMILLEADFTHRLRQAGFRFVDIYNSNAFKRFVNRRRYEVLRLLRGG